MNIQNCKLTLVTGTKVLRHVMSTMLLALGTASLLMTPIGTRAGDFSTQSRHVRLANLNLNSVDGARKAYRRIEAAAWSVCGESSGHIEVMIRGTSDCVKDAVARAVVGVQSVELSKVYINTNGVQRATLYGIASPILTAGNSK